jgi:predicted ester cyclase
MALRWSYAGRHAGAGRYGPPSGADLALLGITHVELRDGRIINEWMLLDDLSVHAQIAAARG